MTHKGLTDSEVNSNRSKFGSNTILSEEKDNLFTIVKEVVLEPMFIILVLSASIYFVVGDFSEGIIMLIAIIFVASISIYQEQRSKSAVEALKKLSSPHATVIRNSANSKILSEEIVKDDLIVLSDGDLIPADAAIIEAHDFTVNESILTGESLSIEKGIKDSENLVFQGTMVLSGSCIAKVTAIGNETKLGKIGKSLIEVESEKTPLQIQIGNFVRYMLYGGIVAFLVVCGLNYYLSHDLLHSFLQGLTLAMSVIPEEIPVAFSTFMALGAYRLYKDKVIAKKPQTVESLGAATVICTDKTGTITQNKMQLASIYVWPNDSLLDYTSSNAPFNEVLNYAMWSSEIQPFDEMEKSIHKKYEETASNDERSSYQMFKEYPLGGTPPFMTHVFNAKNQAPIIACKGAVEGVLNQCFLNPDQYSAIVSKAKELATKGYRVLGVAKSNHDIHSLPASQLELSFEFLGLVAFYDPPKENIAAVIQQFYKAGIQVKMITGDASETTISIAKQVAFADYQHFMSGTEVMAMDNIELKSKVTNCQIYARMFPEAKLKVIEALKSNGEIVAMTGDGVNDGPALKAAHIGIAMGIQGSEIAKNAASLILVDDDFAHMPNAVALGRRIYENLKKAIQYIISIHIPIMLIVMTPLILAWKYLDIFSPVHVIFLELIMGPTCSIIFENEPIEANSMTKPPRKMGTSFLSFKELSISLVQGLVISIACLGVGYYFMTLGHSIELVRTVVFSTLIFSNLFLTLSNRSFTASIFTTIQYKNKLIPLILIISISILFLSIYLKPIRDIFLFETLSINELTICFIASLVGVMWIEFWKKVKS
jgi:P-type Ca2+ transporter type 2C